MPNDYYRLLVPLFLHVMPHLLQTYATVLLLGKENYYEYIKQANFILLLVWTGLHKPKSNSSVNQNLIDT